MTPGTATSATLTDLIDPARARAFQVSMGQTPDIETGSALPPFYHQLYFWSPEPPANLGRDGHPRVGEGLIPDMGLPRRMWAGGRLSFDVPLIAGRRAEKVSEVEQAQHKTGRSGPLGFVTLRHDIYQDGKLCLSEWQDLVYREDADPTADPAPIITARTDESDRRDMEFDTTLLFRYSALTFNGHRIHYDLDYARDTEGYDGLVVHGPLLAQVLMLMAQDLIGPLRRFSFRASSPLLHTERASFCRAGETLWVRGPDGRQCMTATAET